jgi:genome maintenance exonuclease 1
MTFTHNHVTIPELTRETIDGVRYYTVPGSEGDLVKLVSITSVTSHWSREGIAKWRARVGNEEANRVSKRATTRGTDMHLLTEHYLQNETLPKAKVPISQILFNIAKPELNKIDNIIVQEQAMYSLKLGIAVQAAAYACMLYELTGIKAKKLVIIMACENGECKVYEEKDVFKWVKKLDTYVRKFVDDKLALM